MLPSAPQKHSSGDGADLGRYAGLGLQFVITIALLGALGWWLDARLGSTPWLLVLGVLAGSVLAFVTIVRSVPPPTPSSAQHSSPDPDPSSAPRTDDTGPRPPRS